MHNRSLFQPTAKQTKLMTLLADPMDDRTKAEKASALNISVRTLYKWQLLPGWNNTVCQMAFEGFSGELPAILRALAQKARNGDVTAARLLFDVGGLLQSGTTIINNASVQDSGFCVTDALIQRILERLNKEDDERSLPPPDVYIVPTKD